MKFMKALLLLLLVSTQASAKYEILDATIAVGDLIKPEAGAAFIVQSTTLSSLPCPKMTEVQRDALVVSPTGGCVFNLDTLTTEFWSGAQWKEAASQAVLSLWETGAVYGIGAFVYTAGDFKLYIANTAHTAGATFPGDIANWDEASNDMDTIGASTDNAIMRWDGTGGDVPQDSSVIIDDSDNMSGVANLTATGTTTLNTGLTGFLKGASGVVSAQAAINLTSDVGATVLPIANGGTNSSVALVNDFIMYSQGGDIVESSVTLSSSGNMVIDGTLEIQALVSQTGLGNSTYFGFDSGIADDLSTNLNTGFGYEALKKVTTGASNTAIGDQALENNVVGNSNTAIGARTLQTSNISTAANTAVGYLSSRLTSGIHNTTMGSEAGENGTSTSRNTIIGYKAGTRILSNDNVVMGASAASHESGGAMARNVFLGSLTASDTRNGTDNILIGYDLELAGVDDTFKMNIGALLYGDLANDFLGINVLVPTVALDVLGDTILTGALTVTGTTTLATGLTGVAKLASGVVSVSDVDLTSEVTGVLPIANGGTGSATKNFVDLTTTQTIAGVKTLSSKPILTLGFDANNASTIDATSGSNALAVTNNGAGDTVSIVQIGAGEALDISGGQLTIDEDIVMGGTGQIHIPVGTTAQRSGAPADGMVRYNSDLVRYEGYKAGSWDELGGAGGSGQEIITYISNYDIELDATGYTAYADAAGVDPVDGTGGAPTTIVARNTTTPLRAVGDLKLVKDAANRQGEGFSYDFTIASTDQGQTLQASFEYDASDADYSSDDVKFSIYDVTNTTLIEVGGEFLKSGKGKHYFQFAAASNSTSYRMIFHISTTNALAYDLYFDTIVIGPSQLKSESISARYTTNAGQSISDSSTTIVVFEDIDFDNNSDNYNTSTGEYTVSVGGKYLIKSMITYGSLGMDLGELLRLHIHVDGVSITQKQMEFSATNSAMRQSIEVSDILELAKDEIITIRTFQNSGGAEALDTDIDDNFFSMARIK